MKNRIQLGVIFALIIIVFALIFSQNANPDNPTLFGLKRVQEKVFLSLKSGPKDQLEYMSALLDNRLGELSSVVRNKNYNYVLRSASRYSTLAGQMTELLIANNLNGYSDSIKNQFLNHQKVLYDLYVLYPKNFDDEEYKYIEDDINYLKIYLEKLSEVK